MNTIAEIEFTGGWRLLLIFIPVALGSWWLSRLWDIDRIRTYGQERGWRFEEISYRFFGPGWFGEKEERFYAVRYVDEKGAVHAASCKTSIYTGVYFTNDRVLDTRESGTQNPD